MRYIPVQNNIDLIREILTQIRNREDLGGFKVEVAGHDPLVVDRHVERLVGDGFIDIAARFDPLDSTVPIIEARDLSSAGHAFLASLEGEGVWGQIKTVLSPNEIARLSMKQLGRIATDLAEKAIRKKLGLD